MSDFRKVFVMANNKLTLIVGTILVIVVAGGIFYYLKDRRENSSLNIKILTVAPNMIITHVPVKDCRQVTTSKKVKNKNSNFFNRMFDSKKHPEYVTVHNAQEVCNTVMQESQIQNGYVVKYQFNDFIESVLVSIAPPLNVEMPLTDLQKFQPILSTMNASAPVVGENGVGTNSGNENASAAVSN